MPTLQTHGPKVKVLILMSSNDTPLAKYFRSFPLAERRVQMERFQSAHGLSSNQARYFLRKHPCDHQKLKITEEITGFKITRFDLFPEVFNREGLKQLMAKIEAGVGNE